MASQAARSTQTRNDCFNIGRPADCHRPMRLMQIKDLNRWQATLWGYTRVTMTPMTLMVRLVPGESNDRLLGLAGDLATQLGVTQLIGIAGLQPVPIYVTAFTYVPQDLLGRDHVYMERELEAAGDHFHAVLREIVYAGNRGKQIVAEFISESRRDFDEILPGNDPAFEAGSGLSGDCIWEARR